MSISKMILALSVAILTISAHAQSDDSVYWPTYEQTLSSMPWFNDSYDNNPYNQMMQGIQDQQMQQMQIEQMYQQQNERSNRNSELNACGIFWSNNAQTAGKLLQPIK